MSWPKKTVRWATLALILVSAAFAYPWVEHQIAEAIRESRIPAVNKSAPDFTLKNAAGDSVRLSDFKGKVVLLNFWATWCGPCNIETPWFVEFQKQYASQGFTVLGVSMDEDGWSVVTPWLKAHNVTYPILLGNPEIYGGVEALPTSFVIGRDGKIFAIHNGLISKSIYQNEIQNLLGTSGSSSLN